MNRPSALVSSIAILGFATATCTSGTRSPSAPLPAPKPSTEANITRLTSQILGRSQFSHHPLDAQLAAKFLDGYLDELDGSHSLFLASDVASFARYRATLPQATREAGDTSAARAIFTRYLQRLEQRASYVTQLLHSEQFDFSGHERYSFDRQHAQRPRDLNAARVLWREQLLAEYLEQKLADAPPAKIVSTLERRYARNLALMKGLDGGELIELYLNALAHVYDPHSDYLGHEQMESLSSAMSLSLVGIGASLESVDGAAKIRELLPGGPAVRSGLLKPGDRIVAVAQAGQEPVDITSMPLSRAVDLIRGPKGTVVTLSVLPEGTPEGSLPRRIALVRDEVDLEDEQASARIVDLPGEAGPSRIGVLELPSFYASMDGDAAHARRSVTADVARLLAKLKAEHVRGLIVDLRHNGGGSLNEAISLTGLFIHDGPVVQTRGPDGDIEVDDDRDATEQYDGPLILLVSRLSASASEILTGALQDYGRALVVGDSSTFGKGTVQSVLPLGHLMDEAKLRHDYDPGALKFTIRKFYRPNGASTQLRGVVSDIVLPSTTDFSDVSESALEDPLPWDAVAPVPHERMGSVAPYVEALRERSSARVAVDPSFAEQRSEIARLKQDLALKSVSLNEAERRRELAADKARRAQQDLQEQAAASERPKTYLVTLQNAALPGLTEAQTTDPRADPDPEPSDSSAGPRTRRSTADPVLRETERILMDYAPLLRRPG